MASKTCAWHKCSSLFVPEDHRQKYCSKECQRHRNIWKASRGARLIDPLLNNDARALIEARLAILKEIEETTP